MSIPVLINFKICDNAKECNGIAVCPTGALSWDSKKNSIKIDNEKCTSCGACQPACLVGAIRVAKSEKEFQKIKKEIDSDPRKTSDLFVDRYGAQPLHEAFVIPQEKFALEVSHPGLFVAELFNDQSINCLYLSIPIKDLFPSRTMKYFKVAIEDDSILKQYSVSQLPALLFFKEGKLLGKIEGVFTPTHADELKKKISVLVK